MISLVNSLRKHKGFTIIELVVVLAIIGVILAMVLPSMFTSDRPAKGNALAKDFFYKTQDVMTIAKMAYPKSLGDKPSATTLYVVIDTDNSVVETGIYSSSTFKSTGFSGDVQKLVDRFTDCCENYFVTQDNMFGLVFANVNENFAVTSCYWTDIMKDDFKGANKAISDKNIIDGKYCGAYPTYLVEAGETFLVDT